MAAYCIECQIRVQSVHALFSLNTPSTLTKQTLITLRSAIRRVPSLCCLATMACSSPTVAADLDELPASAQTCREVREDSLRARRGFVRTLALEMSPASNRFVFVGVDSLNRARMFSAMINKKVDKIVKSQMVTVMEIKILSLRL